MGLMIQFCIFVVSISFKKCEEASDGAAHEDDLLEICASVGFDEVEVREAIEHLVVANQITHLGEGLYGFAD